MTEGGDFDHFSLFFSNFGPNLSNFTPQMTMNSTKTSLLSALKSVLGICIHSNQLRMDRGQLSDPRWGFDHSSLFFSNFGPNLANFPLK